MAETSDAGGITDLTVLAQTPSLPQEFARAVLTGGGRSGATGTVPGTALQVSKTVDREHLLEYQRLCGFKVNDVLPHTYPHVLGFPLQAALMADPGFPLPMVGLVHIANATTVHRTLTADDELTLTVSAEGLFAHAKGVLVDLKLAVSVAGELVWESTSTYLRRGPSGGTPTLVTEQPEVPAGSADAIWRLGSDLGRRYAAVAGDVNPIHLHPWTAKAMGFPRAIAHGMWTYARTLAALGDQVNRPGRSQVWFRKPVLLPSKVALHTNDDLTVAALTSAKDPDRIHLLLQLDPMTAT